MNQSISDSVALLYDGADCAAVLFDEERKPVWKNKAAQQPAFDFVNTGLFVKCVFTPENEESLARAGTVYLRPGAEFAEPSGLMLSRVEGGCLLLFDAVNASAKSRRFSASGIELFTGLVRGSLDKLNLSAAAVEQAFDTDDPEMEQMFSNIRSSSYQILRGMSNVTLYAGYLSGTLALSRRNCDVGELARAICLSAQSVLKQHIDIAVTVKDAPVIACVDIKLCERALMNILLNAILYTRENNRIAVCVSSQGGKAQIVVRDQGAGIRDENVALAARPFFSTEPAADGGQAPGLGLGLTIASLFCETHGGALVLNSRYGEGTTVALSFDTALENSAGFRASVSNYVTDRFSSLYIELCGVCEIPR